MVGECDIECSLCRLFPCQCVDVGVRVDERPHDFGFAVLGRQYQRRRAAIALSCVRVGACREQCLHHIEMTLPDGDKKGRRALPISWLQLCMRGDECPNDVAVACLRRTPQRGCSIVLNCIDFRVSGKKRPHDGVIPAVGGCIERHHAQVRRSALQIGMGCDERQHDVEVVRLGCDEQRRRVVFRFEIHVNAAGQECPDRCEIAALRRLRKALATDIGRERDPAAGTMEHEKDGDAAP